MKLKDQLNNKIELDYIPKKIICLVPSITELLVDLELKNSIVGITKFCVHPSDLKKNKKVVGGTKNINFNKINTLEPDFIICNKEENTKDIVAECKGVTNTYVSNINTLKDTLELIKDFGEIFSCRTKAKSISNEINRKHLDFLHFMKNKKPKKTAYFIWKNPWMVAGNNTFINHLLEINKFENIFKSKSRYPEIDVKVFKHFDDLEYIFLSSEPYPFKEKDTAELKVFSKTAKIILVDGECFSWYGSRLIKAFDYFKNLQLSLIQSNFSV